MSKPKTIFLVAEVLSTVALMLPACVRRSSVVCTECIVALNGAS